MIKMFFGNKIRTAKSVSFAFLFCVFSSPSFAEGPADVLFGLAATISAATPAVVSGIQAKNDVAIAKSNADLQRDLSKDQTDLSRFRQDSTERMHMSSMELAKDINAQNNAYSTMKLGMMLAETAAERNMRYEQESKERLYQYSLQRKELELAELNRVNQEKLAFMSLEADKIKAGLSTGLKNIKSDVLTTSIAGTKVLKTSVGSQITQATTRSRLLGGFARRGLRTGDKLTRYGFMAQGSTRTLRQKGVSDLSFFQASIGNVPRQIASVESRREAQGFSDDGLRRHRPLDYGRNTDVPSHR